MNARLPQPLPLEPTALQRHVDTAWRERIVPELVRYIEVPAKSPAFDSQWAEHGLLEQVRRAFDGLGLATAESDDEQPWRLAALRAETRLPLPDCCVLDVAIESGGDLATFDTRLAAAARRHGVALATT